MSDRHVTDDAGSVGVCGCGCGRQAPPPPAGGGRGPVYASHACRQRAYRTRTAARTPPADPVSVAGLLGAVRAVGVVLDTGRTPGAELVAAVRREVTGLLDRLDTADSAAAADGANEDGVGEDGPPAPATRPGPEGGEGLTDLTAALAGGQDALDTAAATLARHGRGHTLRPQPESTPGTYRLLLTGDVYGGSVTRDHRGWTGWIPGPLPHRTGPYRTRARAVTAVLDALDTHHRTRRRRRR